MQTKKLNNGVQAMLNSNNMKGATAAGWLIIVMVVLFFIYITIKLAPVYMEYGSIKSSMSSLYEAKAGNKSASEIRRLFSGRLTINGIDVISAKDAIIKKTPEGKTIIVKYEQKVPMFGNVSALVEFENEQPLQ